MDSLEQFYTRVNASIATDIKVAQQVESQDEKDAFQKQKQDWGFDPQTWQVFWLNTKRMMSVLRKTGEPYATHPTRMAMLALSILGQNESGQQSARICLLHDYLEEGDGVSRESIYRLGEDLGSKYGSARSGAALLTEPVIDYKRFPRPRRWMEQVAYVLQVRIAADRLTPEHYNSIYLDKVDNGHDWRYITENESLSEERRRVRLMQKLGYFSFVAEAFADKVELRILHLLRETIDQSAREFAVTKDEIRFVKESYENTLVEHRDVLEKAIEAYWSEIGIDENPFAADDSSHGGD
jgi:hypothetical protein